MIIKAKFVSCNRPEIWCICCVKKKTGSWKCAFNLHTDIKLSLLACLPLLSFVCSCVCVEKERVGFSSANGLETRKPFI